MRTMVKKDEIKKLDSIRIDEKLQE